MTTIFLTISNLSRNHFQFEELAIILGMWQRTAALHSYLSLPLQHLSLYLLMIITHLLNG